MTFYERCEQLAKENKVTMKELGIAVGVTGASITGWKTGSLPRVDIAVKVAKYFGVTVEYLVEGDTNDSDISPEERKLIQWYQATSLKTQLLNVAKELSVISEPVYDPLNED